MGIILESPRLLFRPHLKTDLDAFCNMEMDPNVRRYAGGNPRTREEAEKRFPGNQAENAGKERLAVWAAILKTGNLYIGRSGLYPHFNRDGGQISGEAALSFYIAYPHWRNGFATEAGKAFIDFGFTELALQRISATVMKGNDASVHILEKLGFALVSTEEGQRTFYHFTLQNPTKGQ